MATSSVDFKFTFLLRGNLCGALTAIVRLSTPDDAVALLERLVTGAPGSDNIIVDDQGRTWIHLSTINDVFTVLRRDVQSIRCGISGYDYDEEI